MPLKMLPALIALGLVASPTAALALAAVSAEDAPSTSAGARTPASGVSGRVEASVDIAVREEAARRPGAPASEAMAIAEHYERIGDSRRAAEWYSKASVAGDTRAQTKVAETLLRASKHPGLTEAQRQRAQEQAIALLRHAAQARNGDAAYRLYQLHSDGTHVPVHTGDAERWLTAAADAGHPDAAFSLAMRLMQPSAGAPDLQAALPLFERAGTAGHPEALRQLVEHHLQRTPPALDSAMVWAQRAAEHGNLSLQHRVADAREREAQRLAAAEREAEMLKQAEAARLAEAEREAEALRQAHAERRVEAEREAETVRAAAASASLPTAEPAAMTRALADDASMALVLDVLDPVPSQAPQPSLADLLAEMQAMRAELVTVQQQLADRDALLAERDRQIATLKAQIERDQEQRHAAAVADEARRKNESGLAAFRAGNHAAAFSRFDAAARAGNAQAMNNLATLYMNGHGVARSPDRAIEFFTLAANAGNAQAAANLGNLYARGTDGVQRNSAQAEEWYRRAEMLGHAKAGEYLRAFEAQRMAGN